MTHSEHAQQIAESIANGQPKRARAQWLNAIDENCNPVSLAHDMRDYLIDDDIIEFLAKVAG